MKQRCLFLLVYFIYLGFLGAVVHRFENVTHSHLDVQFWSNIIKQRRNNNNRNDNF